MKKQLMLALGFCTALAFVPARLVQATELSAETNDFQTIFNSYRYSQAKILPWPGIYWPFDGRDQGAGINHVPPGQDKSPAQKYDEFFATGGTAAKWEEANHNCDTRPAEQQEACRGWYGHCNGWTGAALNFPEPDYNNPITVTNPDTGVTETFSYMDIKALLTEAWLDVYASYEGTGMGMQADSWIFDPNSESANSPLRTTKQLRTTKPTGTSLPVRSFTLSRLTSEKTNKV